jgi:hypothetical protein
MCPDEKITNSKYYKKLISTCVLLVSTFLLAEHLWTYDGFDLLDFIGHEYLALLGILFIFLWNMKWNQWKELKLWKIRNCFR